MTLFVGKIMYFEESFFTAFKINELQLTSDKAFHAIFLFAKPPPHPPYRRLWDPQIQIVFENKWGGPMKMIPISQYERLPKF